MFRTDEIEARQKIEDIRAEVESSKQKNGFRKNKKKYPSIWIMLISILRSL